MIRLDANAVAAIESAYLDDEGWEPVPVKSLYYAESHVTPIVEWWNAQIEQKEVEFDVPSDQFVHLHKSGTLVNANPIGGIPVPAGSVLCRGCGVSNGQTIATLRIRRPPLLWNDVVVDGAIVQLPIFRTFEHEEVG